MESKENKLVSNLSQAKENKLVSNLSQAAVSILIGIAVWFGSSSELVTALEKMKEDGDIQLDAIQERIQTIDNAVHIAVEDGLVQIASLREEIAALKKTVEDMREPAKMIEDLSKKAIKDIETATIGANYLSADVLNAFKMHDDLMIRILESAERLDAMRFDLDHYEVMWDKRNSDLIKSLQAQIDELNALLFMKAQNELDISNLVKQ